MNRHPDIHLYILDIRNEPRIIESYRAKYCTVEWCDKILHFEHLMTTGQLQVV